MRPAVGENYILYNSRCYSLTEHRLAYRRDKSKDESFFLLTLFGVAYELLATDAYDPGQTASVDLLIGLPPACAAANRRESFAPFSLPPEATVVDGKQTLPADDLAAICDVIDAFRT